MKSRSVLFALSFSFAAMFAASDLAAQPVPVLPPPQPGSLDTLLKWDAERKEQTVANGTPQAFYTFNLTNVSAQVVTINQVFTSCGCTVAKLPEQPWHIAPGATGQISATMNLAGKFGTSSKTLTVNSDKGVKQLIVQVTILPAGVAQQMTAQDREKNQKLAIADRQAVFKGDCASCHAAPAKDKYGQQLFTAACGVCHEGQNRGTMVPDLHAIAQQTNADFWRNWITHGKPGSLMPAFAISEGGILSDEQINSLVNYLIVAYPSKPASPPAKTISAN